MPRSTLTEAQPGGGVCRCLNPEGPTCDDCPLDRPEAAMVEAIDRLADDDAERARAYRAAALRLLWIAEHDDPAPEHGTITLCEGPLWQAARAVTEAGEE